MARIVFMGTPGFALPSLRRLAGCLHEVAAVYTQPDRPAGRGRRLAQAEAKTLALELGLPVSTPGSLKREAEVEELRRLAPDALVVVAYGKLLPKAVLEVPPRGVLNLHPSLLPRYRGPSPIAAAILAGDAVTGTTVMLLDEGMDSGPVLAQEEEPIAAHDTAVSLGERLAERGAALLEETLGRWLAGEIEPRLQDDAEATICKLVKKQDGEIEWSESAAGIERKLRAYTPWPGVATAFEGRRLGLTRARPVPGGGGEPGRVVVLDGDPHRVGVVTGEGVLEVLAVKPEGRREMTVMEFLAGRPGFVGARLPS